MSLPAGHYSCMLHGGNATPMTWSETYLADTVYSMTLFTRSTPRTPGRLMGQSYY